MIFVDLSNDVKKLFLKKECPKRDHRQEKKQNKIY